MTGQRLSGVLNMRRQDLRDGYLQVAQHRTWTKLRIAVVGTLAAIFSPTAFTLSVMRRWFSKRPPVVTTTDAYIRRRVGEEVLTFAQRTSKANVHANLWRILVAPVGNPCHQLAGNDDPPPV